MPIFNNKITFIHIPKSGGSTIETFLTNILPNCQSIEVLCEKQTLAELKDAETKYINQYESYNPERGYNKTLGGDGGSPTEEVRKKLSIIHKGRKFSEEHIQKL